MNRRHFIRRMGNLVAVAALATPIGRELARVVEREEREEGEWIAVGQPFRQLSLDMLDGIIRQTPMPRGVVASFDERTGTVTMKEPIPKGVRVVAVYPWMGEGA